jgi:hypothetical protein
MSADMTRTIADERVRGRVQPPCPSRARGRGGVRPRAPGRPRLRHPRRVGRRRRRPDRREYRDELAWQEFTRHLDARFGRDRSRSETGTRVVRSSAGQDGTGTRRAGHGGPRGVRLRRAAAGPAGALGQAARDPPAHRDPPGRVVDELRDRRLAVTFAPVPGPRRRSEALGPAVVHPWRWLFRPRAGRMQSSSAWRKGIPAQPDTPGVAAA